MPVYEYRCRACNHQFEATQAFSDDALTECPECGGELRKVFGSVGIAFKGSGFYKNDSRSGSSSSGTTASSSTGSESSGSNESTTSSSDSGSTKSSDTSASSST
ncbi:MAG: FmdB family zinc ribbon protein, partial [Actinomycetes bacterium]